MDTRFATIWPRHQYTADITEIIDVDIADPISQIIVSYEPDNNPSAINATGYPALCITKIELVDGSDTIFSLSGVETQAVDFYHSRIVPPNIITYLNGMYSYMVMNMNFGRYLWDPMLALDPKKFRNLQLKISIDIDAGGDEANDGYLTVLAQIFDEKTISPMGYLMHKEIKSYTLANSSHEYTDLPTDHPYKQLFLRAQRYGTLPDSQIDTVKLTEDVDRRIPLNHTMTQIIESVAQEWPAWIENILVMGWTTASYNYCAPCWKGRFTDTQWRSAVATAEASIYSGSGGRFQHDAEAAGPNHQVHCVGWAPHAVVPLLPEFGQDYDGWYDVTKIGNLKLDVLAGSSVGTSQTAEIVTSQLRKYT